MSKKNPAKPTKADLSQESNATAHAKLREAKKIDSKKTFVRVEIKNGFKWVEKSKYEREQKII